jgi:hypothetical protein
LISGSFSPSSCPPAEAWPTCVGCQPAPGPGGPKSMWPGCPSRGGGLRGPGQHAPGTGGRRAIRRVLRAAIAIPASSSP